jgi:hypothetical protein
MGSPTKQLVDSFALDMKAIGVPIRVEDNSSRLDELEARLPSRLPQSFEYFLSRYSFPAFDAGGISFFGWESTSRGLFEVVSVSKDPLSETLLPSGFFQIGRPDTASSDAVCFDQNARKQNREYRIVQVDHEEILCNFRIKIVRELWPSFRKLIRTRRPKLE